MHQPYTSVMSRPLRLQFPGALYHVTSRGDKKCAIYQDHTDYTVWLSILGEICAQYNFVIHGYCQMTNHYHLIAETIDGNLSRGMQQLNGRYSQYYNRRHGLVGHVFQGRFKAILVQRDQYLMELVRYVVLNPLRAGLVTSLDDWKWSNYADMVGKRTAPEWLDTLSTLQNFSARDQDAVTGYCRFVTEGIGRSSPLLNTRHQLMLGDDKFVASVYHPADREKQRAVVKQQRRVLALSLEEYTNQSSNRDEAMAKAYCSNAYTMRQIAEHFGLSDKTVSRSIKKYRTR